MSEMHPNILFITADQWRGDCTGFAGHKIVQTPRLDALAARGTAFLNHYAAAAPCSPARAAMYTGLYQMNNRVVGNGAPLGHRFDNIARAARRAGYTPTLFGYTDIAADPGAHVSADPALRTYEGVLPGFEVEQALLGDQRPWKAWLKDLGYAPDIVEDPYGYQREDDARLPIHPAAFKTEHSQTAYLVNRTIDWLDLQPQDTPWFAHLSLIHPHPPFVVSEPFFSMYSDAPDTGFRTVFDDVLSHQLVAFLQDKPADDFVPAAQGCVADLSAESLERIRRIYYGLISEVDMQLGRLFDALEDGDQLNNTIIVFTSDHGEMMGDFGLLGKGGFFPESQHIPLVISGPGFDSGRSFRGLTSAVDLFPTFLDWVGIPAHNSLDGASLAQILTGDTDHPGRDAVLWEYDYRELTSSGDLPSGPLDMAGDHLLAMLKDGNIYVSSPGRDPLLLTDAVQCATISDVADDPSAAQLRLHMAEYLLRLRQIANDQTLANIRLGPRGAVDISKGQA